MKLKQVEVASDFNDAYAREMFEKVMAMDEEEARFFTTTVVGEVVFDTIAKNQRTFQKNLDRVALDRVNKLSKALERTVVSKRMGDEPFDEEEALARAGALALISKAIQSPYTQMRWDESEHRRNAKGQFTTKIHTATGTKPLKGKRRVDAGIAKKPGIKLKPEEAARYQQQYLQVKMALDKYGPDANNMMVVRDRKNPADYSIVPAALGGKGNKPNYNGWDPKTQDVTEVITHPGELTLGGAAFNLVGAVGGSPGAAAYGSGVVTEIDTNMPNFQDAWNKAPDAYESSSTAGAFDRLQTGAHYLEMVAPAGSKLQMASSFGEFAGKAGPEAEKVIGPHARRTAYRYRGVTKKPDNDLVRAYEGTVRRGIGPTQDQRTEIKTAQTRAVTAAVKAKARETGKPVEAVRLTNEERVKAMNAAQARVQNAQRRTLPPEAREAARNQVVSYLFDQKRRPSSKLYNLQLHAGQTPPSEGVIIDRNGKISAQAVGYGDDHYLPFNLKQLGALRGGEYVRTRSVGGPTAEDVYTGLVGGAKGMTVTSRSGTFIVEFQDDFKKGRRYNDKAARMVNRYRHLLDAVESQKVERDVEIPPQIRDRIEDRVRRENRFANEREIRTKQIAAIKEYRNSPDLTQEDLDFIKDGANAIQAADERIPRAEAERQMRTLVNESREFQFRLNGQGYEDALKALQEQFPYYIKSVQRVPNSDDESRGKLSIDRGYVKPKYNRPTAAKAGWYDASISGVKQADGTGKFGADQADYQNLRARGGRSTRETQDRGPKEDKTETTSDVQQKERSLKAGKFAYAMALGTVYDHLNEKGLISGDKRFQKADGTQVSTDEFRKDVEEKGHNSAYAKSMESLVNASDANGSNKARIFGTGAGQLNEDVWNAAIKAKNDIASGGSKYSGAAPEALDAEINDNDGLSVKSEKKISEMSDEELDHEIHDLEDVKRIYEKAKDLGSVNGESTDPIFNDLMKNVPDHIQQAVAGDPANVDKLIERVKAVKGAKAAKGSSAGKAQGATAPAARSVEHEEAKKAGMDIDLTAKEFNELAGFAANNGYQEVAEALFDTAETMKRDYDVAEPQDVAALGTWLNEGGYNEMAALMRELKQNPSRKLNTKEEQRLKDALNKDLR